MREVSRGATVLHCGWEDGIIMANAEHIFSVVLQYNSVRRGELKSCRLVECLCIHP